jgi:hypothetical protein
LESWFEAPRSKLRGIFDRREYRLFLIRSLTPQQATEIALAISVQPSMDIGYIFHPILSKAYGAEQKINYSNPKAGLKNWGHFSIPTLAGTPA